MRAGTPIIAGTPYRMMVSRNMRMRLATMAGNASGSVIVHVTRTVPAPRTRAASSTSPLIISSVL